MTDPDRDLVARWHRGGEERERAAREMFELFWRRVAAYFHHHGHFSESARDLTQETFLRVFKGMETFRGEIPLGDWILKIAMNIHRSEIRSRNTLKRYGQEISLSEPLPALSGLSTGAEPERATLSRERSEALHRALETLPPKMRSCVELRIQYDLSDEEIARRLDIPSPETVRAHLWQARKRLREILGRHFGEPGF